MVTPVPSCDAGDLERSFSHSNSAGPKRRACCFCCFRRRLAKFLCCSLLLAIILVVVAGIVAGIYFALELPSGIPIFFDGQLLTPWNLTSVNVWPGCKVGWKDSARFQECGQPCFSAALPQEMADFNRNYSYQLVRFNSRPGPAGHATVEIAAWWLPAGMALESSAEKPSPRIVVQHGYSGNFNDWSVQLAAFLLRSGPRVGVLAPNLRNHGLSGRTGSGHCTWGWSYVYDTLGAWDYAVRDPDGVLGGPLPSNQVGIMGFSMGGFVASSAFGLEPLVPAVWIDSGVFDPRQELRYIVGRFLGPFAFLIADIAWMTSNVISAVPDLDYYRPASLLPNGPRTRRPVALVQNQADTLVPKEQTAALERLLREHPSQYEVRDTIYPSVSCNGETHLVSELHSPTLYQQRLCAFWSGVFNMTATDCNQLGIARLGSF